MCLGNGTDIQGLHQEGKVCRKAGKEQTHGQGPFTEYDDVHIQGFKVCLTIRILIERSETDQVVVPEQLDLLSSFFQQDILCRQRVDPKHLKNILDQKQ